MVGNYANSGKEKSVAKQNYSYRTKQWRYIRYSNGAQELYNHDDDPHEWNNLANSEQSKLIIKQLKLEISAIVGQEF